VSDKIKKITYSDYKNYVNDVIASMPIKVRGIKKDIPLVLGCLPTYVSQVLGGELHFNLEQADDIRLFLPSKKYTTYRYLHN
jgi:hypothetical protein